MKTIKMSEAGARKRGRPAGKDRVPLSAEERRARNAQYERERREELAEAVSDLAEAAGCSSTVSNKNLLLSVIEIIHKHKKQTKKNPTEVIRKENGLLEREISLLELELEMIDM